MRSSRINETLLFLIVVFLELSLITYLILNHRMVIGHDGFEWFVDQWYFVNGKVSHNEIPLWTPYMAHGQVTSYIYNRLGMFPNILMLFSDWIKGINFLPLYYLGLFFDKFILLTGTWLLAKRYFKSPVTVCFVASSLLASTITLTQISHTILLIYCLPLTLYLLHRFFDDRDWKWLFFSVFLISVVSINIYYFIAVFSLAVFLYFLVVFFISPVKDLKRFKIRSTDAVFVIGIGAIAFFIMGVFFLEHDPLLSVHVPYREPDGHIGLSVFLTYGGSIYLFKWWELFLGVSPAPDYTIYLGLLTVPLIFIGSVSKNKNKYPFLIGAIFFLLFSLSTPVTVIAYYCWPMMKYFRHIGLITPLIKFYLCFLAGFGFEELFDLDKSRGSEGIFHKCLFSCILLFLNGLFLFQLANNANSGYFFITHLIGDTRINLLGNIMQSLFYTAYLSMIGSLFFFVRPFINIPKYGHSYVLALIFFHLMVIYGYAYEQAWERSFPLTQNEYNLMEFQKIPFIKHRSVNGDRSPRGEFVHSFEGTLYDETYNFTFGDMVKTRYRSDISLKPYDRLQDMFNNRDLSPVLLKLAGSSEDKIQIFSNAYPLKSVVSAIQDKNFTGDMLFYYPFDDSWLKSEQLKGLDLSQNQRLSIPYKILSFGPDQIVIGIDHVAQKGAWMEYCDTWHSQWKAEVNGRPQGVYIGNVAYKAVPLDKGRNIVRFYFESDRLKWAYYYFMVGSFIWMVLLICLLIGCPA